MSNQTLCIPCPHKLSTPHAGSSSEEDCTNGAIEIMVRSEGWADSVMIDKANFPYGKAVITVNGVDHSQHKRGYNLVAVDFKTGKVESSKAFDTHGNFRADEDMLNYVKGLPNGKIVIAAIQDDGTSAMYTQGYDALLAVGGKEPFQRNYRGTYALIGYKGTGEVTWINQASKMPGRGPTILRARLTYSVDIVIESEAYDDPGKGTVPGVSAIYVNGVDRSLHRRGHNLVTIDEVTGQFDSVAAFDTHGGGNKANIDLKKYIDGLDNGKIVIVAVQDEGYNQLGVVGIKALQSIGAVNPKNIGYRGSFAFLGYKGTSKRTWVQQLSNARWKGPTTLKASVPLLRN